MRLSFLDKKMCTRLYEELADTAIMISTKDLTDLDLVLDSLDKISNQICVTESLLERYEDSKLRELLHIIIRVENSLIRISSELF